MAPVLSVTAEEILSYMPGERGDSVFLEQWHTLPEVRNKASLLKRWQVVTALRVGVSLALESLRKEGVIGSSLNAEVTIYTEGKTLELLQSFADETRFIFITSYVHVYRIEDRDGRGTELKDWSQSLENWSDDTVAIDVCATGKEKCIRCWHHYLTETQRLTVSWQLGFSNRVTAPISIAGFTRLLLNTARRTISPSG